MKVVVFAFLFMFVCIVVTACNQEPPLPESDRLAYKLSGRTAEHLNDKYDLRLIGVGLSGSGDEDKLKEIELTFSLTHLVTKAEGRDLILKCIEDFLHEINDFEEIRPYLVHFPFTYEDIGLRILFYSDARYEPTLDPNIDCISLIEGVISYDVSDAQNRFKIKSIEKETYEEALKIQNRMN